MTLTLVTIPDVEIVSTGTYQLSSGETTFTAEDMVAAVGAVVAASFGARLDDGLSDREAAIPAVAAAVEQAKKEPLTAVTVNGVPEEVQTSVRETAEDSSVGAFHVGVGIATALVATVGDARAFTSGRHLAAWLGLVPRQRSSGGKERLLGISKRGNRYVRRMLTHGARSCVTHLDRTRDKLGSWLDALEERMHGNKVTIALANKIARIAWVILTRPGALYERHDPAVA